MAFNLNIPDVEQVKTEVENQVKVSDERSEQIQTVVDTQTQEIMKVDLTSISDRDSIVSTIETFGDDAMQASSRKNDFLQTRIGTLSKSGSDSGSTAKSLADLSVKMKELDPKGIDFTSGAGSKLFSPVRRYFVKYEKADTSISNIIKTLENGKKMLTNDNKTLEIEEIALRKATIKLNEYINMGVQLDASISNAIENAKLNGEDEDKIKFLEEEVLFPLRQKILDFQSRLSVNIQGVMAAEMIRRNNQELIRAANRAINVSVDALRIAVIVAGALANQKIVVNAVNIINEGTSNIIESNARMLKSQGTEIMKQASAPMLDIEKMKNAYVMTFEAFDEIDKYKQEALPQLKETIDGYIELGKEGEKRIKKLEQGSRLSLED